MTASFALVTFWGVLVEFLKTRWIYALFASAFLVWANHVCDEFHYTFISVKYLSRNVFRFVRFYHWYQKFHTLRQYSNNFCIDYSVCVVVDSSCLFEPFAHQQVEIFWWRNNTSCYAQSEKKKMYLSVSMFFNVWWNQHPDLVWLKDITETWQFYRIGSKTNAECSE